MVQGRRRVEHHPPEAARLGVAWVNAAHLFGAAAETTDAGRRASTYDAAGNVLTQNDSTTTGTDTTRSYFLNSWPRSEADVVAGLPDRTIGYRYYGDGAEFGRILYNGAAVEMASASTMGDAGEVTSTIGQGWGHGIATWAHTYDRAGRRTSTVDPTSPIGRRSETVFNADGTTREVQHLAGGTGSAVLARWSYAYDAAQRVASAAHAAAGAATSMTDRYRYDAAGHLDRWTADSTAGTDVVNDYTYDADGNRTSAAGIPSTYRADGSILTSGGSAPFGYNGAGALKTDTTAGSCSTRTYDGLDRMLTQSQGTGCTGGTHSYTYLPDNRQATRTNAGTVTRNRWAAGALLSEETAVATATARYIVTPAGTHAVSDGSATPLVQHLKEDGQGNTGLLTRPSGTVTACAVAYDPWGSPRQFANATQCATTNTTNNIYYRGAARDPGSGTYRWGNRNYNPATGTWLTADTYQAPEAANDLSIGTDPLTANRYSYVNGDPVNLTDPSGHRLCDDAHHCANPGDARRHQVMARQTFTISYETQDYENAYAVSGGGTAIPTIQLSYSFSALSLSLGDPRTSCGDHIECAKAYFTVWGMLNGVARPSLQGLGDPTGPSAALAQAADTADAGALLIPGRACWELLVHRKASMGNAVGCAIEAVAVVAGARVAFRQISSAVARARSGSGAFGSTPGGRPYTYHYGVDTGPIRNLPGSVVDEAIDNYPGKPIEGGKVVHYDPYNDVTVVTGDGQSIVSARKGPPRSDQR